ncbi:hypothetical protein SLITO_v1c03960 [Spiroplasma litorale]|uniref:Transmembrane protein n=1 Tax=Spiroplasma litorale TaxID=216942 RepID=A0A0K1W150_9MOLU|nr:hypothetical protein [Spiroplasma litorale]AKX34049.1 hypothetical protein SLITO_v1c03960 [Spiroplasma litorale]
MNQNKINPRSLIINKFLFTFGYLFIYLISFILLLKVLKEQKDANSLFIENKTYLALTIFFLIASMIAFTSFFIIRFTVNKKTGYKYSKKELIYVSITIILLFLSYVMSIIVISSIYFIKSNILAFIISILVIQIIFGIISSILEGLTRIKEQHMINSAWDEVEPKTNLKNKSQTKPKEDKMMDLKKSGKYVNPFKDGEKEND